MCPNQRFKTFFGEWNMQNILTFIKCSCKSRKIELVKAYQCTVSLHCTVSLSEPLWASLATVSRRTHEWASWAIGDTSRCMVNMTTWCPTPTALSLAIASGPIFLWGSLMPALFRFWASTKPYYIMFGCESSIFGWNTICDKHYLSI